MADSPRPGGLYLADDKKTYVDANGQPVENKKEITAAVRKHEQQRDAAAAGAAARTAPADAGTTPATAPADTTGEPKRGTLPEDFPHRAILESAGITSYGKLREADLSTVDGIGPARQAEIEAALKA